MKCECAQWQNASLARRPEQEVLFEICGACGLIWLDFGSSRPALHRALERQTARWSARRAAIAREDDLIG
jgi:Zn-finger nucleic acid-binding protein